MDAIIRQLLEASDDPEGCEFPLGDPSCRRGALAESVRSIQRALRDDLNLAMDLDGCVQDASFHDELHVLHPDSDPGNGVVALFSEIAIRFSNFGRLYTVHSALPSIPARYAVDQIKAIVERHGWRYVPADQLEEIYDGTNKVLRDGRNTWWIRFFDYL